MWWLREHLSSPLLCVILPTSAPVSLCVPILFIVMAPGVSVVSVLLARLFGQLWHVQR